MAEPPKSTPHSDIDGVNRDARIGTPSTSQEPDPGSAINNAQDETVARPKETPPSG